MKTTRKTIDRCEDCPMYENRDLMGTDNSCNWYEIDFEPNEHGAKMDSCRVIGIAVTEVGK